MGTQLMLKVISTWLVDIQVKHELESGVGMKPQLVTRSLRELTQLAADTGVLHQRAAQLLSLVTFMRKAVGMSEDLLQHHVRFLGAMQLLYSPQQLDAIAAQGKPAPRPTPPVVSPYYIQIFRTSQRTVVQCWKPVHIALACWSFACTARDIGHGVICICCLV